MSTYRWSDDELKQHCGELGLPTEGEAFDAIRELIKEVQQPILLGANTIIWNPERIRAACRERGLPHHHNKFHSICVLVGRACGSLDRHTEPVPRPKIHRKYWLAACATVLAAMIGGCSVVVANVVPKWWEYHHVELKKVEPRKADFERRGSPDKEGQARVPPQNALPAFPRLDSATNEIESIRIRFSAYRLGLPAFASLQLSIDDSILRSIRDIDLNQKDLRIVAFSSHGGFRSTEEQAVRLSDRKVELRPGTVIKVRIIVPVNCVWNGTVNLDVMSKSGEVWSSLDTRDTRLTVDGKRSTVHEFEFVVPNERKLPSEVH